eukprot:SAG11_NODE_2443_length_3354_cov_9.181874_2_plen_185_part_00
MSSSAGVEEGDNFGLSDRCSFADAAVVPFLPPPEFVEILQFQDDRECRWVDFCRTNHGGIDSAKGPWLLGGKSRTSHPKHWLKLHTAKAGTLERIHLELVESCSERVAEHVVAVHCAELQDDYFHFQLKAERLGRKHGRERFILRFSDVVYSRQFRVFAMAPERQLRQQRKRARRAVNAADSPE